MRKDLVLPVSLAALILAAIFVIAPKATAITYEGSAEVYGLDIVGLTLSAKGLPEQRYAAF